MERVVRRILAVLLFSCGAACLAFGVFRPSMNVPFVLVRFDGSWAVAAGVALAVLSVVSLWIPARWTSSVTTFSWAIFLAFVVTQRPPQRGDVEWGGRASEFLTTSTGPAKPKAGSDDVASVKPGESASAAPAVRTKRMWKSPYDWMESNQTADENFGWRGIAGIVARDKHRDFEVDYTHDADGWRVMPQPASHPPKGTIAFVGCSLTYGMGVADWETYPAILAKEAWTNCRIENHSFSGWGTGQALIAVQKLVRESPRPNLIVYGFITNHLKRNYLRQAWFRKLGNCKFPYISLDAQGQLVFEGLRPTEEATAPDNAETARREDAVTLAMVREMSRLCQEAGVGLAVVILEQLEERVVKELATDSSLNVIDLHRVCYDFHPIDFHPRPNWHRWIAHCLAADERIAKISGLPELYQPRAVSVVGIAQSEPRFVLSKADSNARFVTGGGPVRSWRVEGIELNGAKSFHIQLVYEPFALTEGKKYAFRFQTRSDRERTFTVLAADRMDRDRRLGLFQEMRANPEWRTIEASFAPLQSSKDAMMVLQLGNSDIPIEFRELEVLEEGRRIGPAVAVPPDAKARE